MKSAVLHWLSVAFDAAQKVPVLARLVDISTSSLVSLLRCASGSWVATGLEKCRRPEKLLKLYEFEGCPYCRKVRETLCVLDLDYQVLPCPKESVKGGSFVPESSRSRFRPEVAKLGGEQKFPYLVDENTGVKMHESDKINEYLWKTYGEGAEAPLAYRLGVKLSKTPFFMLPVLMRPCLKHGILRVPSKAPEQPLELWGAEPSPFVRLVREALCVLELPYVHRSVAHGSHEKRLEFREKYGDKLSLGRRVSSSTTVQMPFLRDPNTGAEWLESADIVKYLYDTYQCGAPLQETWYDFKMPQASAGRESHQKAE